MADSKASTSSLVKKVSHILPILMELEDDSEEIKLAHHCLLQMGLIAGLRLEKNTGFLQFEVVVLKF